MKMTGKTLSSFVKSFLGVPGGSAISESQYKIPRY
jgi:hypothetical protein